MKQQSETPVLVESVADWLAAEGLVGRDIESLVEGCCERLLAAGIPLLRAYTAFTILHPLYSGSAVTWQRGHQLERLFFEHNSEGGQDRFNRSPHFHMINSGVHQMRRRLTGPDALIDFPVLEELKAEGGTDYYAFVIPFGDTIGDGIIGSWQTDRPGGFTEAEISHLTRVQQRLALACRMAIKTQLADNVMTTYLGRNAGRQVMAGSIRRGDGRTIRAAVWYSDLRGSTEMAERMSRDEYTEVLNTYFEGVGEAVTGEDGEILDFIGDAVLAMFPVDETRTAEEACARALAASAAAARHIAAANDRRATLHQPPLAFGLALHLGEVMFGNIGTRDRLSFSVIGSCVNEVARLQDMTKELGAPVVASGDFAKAAGGDWRPLGHHKLRGVSREIEIVAPES